MLGFLAVIVVWGLLLAGCGGGSSSDTGGGNASAGGNGESTTVAATTAEAAADAGEKVLRIARDWEDNSWDPATFTGAAQLALTQNIFETLCKLETDGSSSPLLAESWELSPDGLQYTFRLRQGAQFHQGYGEMTSEDVKFSFERNSDPDVGSIHAEALNLDNITSIETPDDYTVVFNLVNPDVDFITRCSQYQSIIVSQAAFDAIGLEGFASTPVGTGPFAYDGGTPGIKTEAVRFEDYWGAAPKLDRIVYTIIADTNVIYSAFENGELDIIYVYYQDKVNEYEEKGYSINYIPSDQLLYVGLNVQLDPWRDMKVREAFFHAVDPQYFLDELFYGNETFPGGYIPPNSKYALTDYLKPTYDPAKAKALLAEAGYPDGIDVTLWSVNDELGTAPSLVVQSKLKESGFNVELQLVDFGVFIDQVRGGTAGMWLLYNSTPPLADDTINRYTSAFYPGSNWIGLTDPVYDGLVAEGLNASTEEEKTEALYEAQRYFLDLKVLYPISTYGYHFITQPNVTGAKLWGDLSLHLNEADVG
jgi:peptide/nickel transport system substrate-binding protein